MLRGCRTVVIENRLLINNFERYAATDCNKIMMMKILPAGVRGLHNLEINVPNAVLVGETVSLECSWQLEDEEALYSVKWYRGREEFYRYIPKELPHTRVFPLPGIEVDVSNLNKLFLGSLDIGYPLLLIMF